MSLNSTRNALSLCIVLLSPSALAVPTRAVTSAAPPVSLSFAQQDGWRFRWGLRNVTSRPVEVVADRRLVSLELPPPEGARGRRARPRRCVHAARPASNETLARVRLEPGEVYSELVDLRDTCNLRVPDELGAGPVTVRYGFREARRPSHLRSVVVDETPEVFPEVSLVTTVTPPAPTPEPAPVSGLGLTVSRANAAHGEGLVVTARLTNHSVQPVWTSLRPMQFGFTVTAPSGRVVGCEAITRAGNAQRDTFVRLAGGARRAVTLLPSLYCPRGTFDESGIYDVTASFRSRDPGDEFDLGRVFTGEVESAAAVWRISRGAGHYMPIEPRFGD